MEEEKDSKQIKNQRNKQKTTREINKNALLI
jgi:hypothetical protein